ncbi:O-sialoglycoprotein endopeptidase [Mycoplasma haemocanis str. Illinois]|uniref:N(6)-L-threonylcarbamoyladenine synthase n=1 Tax=Mycoplasma haemocanis (strain Illinois) TaxID=1111676 RepID=H6N8L7_MYCHN|nr:tRNA (adenosine(37)-N6)-threonylcarbamoyltransferase complex transferase subunit TsaD [Mycoplasma haemocanis]AEW45989.1 O-sialoglycoprotein endopeptidase [Mycoplasma haemocanis str. Illinois]
MGSLILGIETSCDDTSVALVRNGKLIDVITESSASLQNSWGGVVPEIAARYHGDRLVPILGALLDRNHLSLGDITHIAYTSHPGLAGCLLTGQVFAKSLAFLIKKPLIPVNHVYGHVFSVGLTHSLDFPHLALVVSGKTTSLFLVNGYRQIYLLDETKDNAIGEVYDKVARRLDLGYPGGMAIDEMFDENLNVPQLLKNRSNPAKPFSYAGILSATMRICDSMPDLKAQKGYVATIFQKWVIDELIVKIKYWIGQTGVNTLTVSGGVAANRYLRAQMKSLNIRSLLVDGSYSGDNAAMIAYYAYFLI